MANLHYHIGSNQLINFSFVLTDGQYHAIYTPDAQLLPPLTVDNRNLIVGSSRTPGGKKQEQYYVVKKKKEDSEEEQKENQYLEHRQRHRGKDARQKGFHRESGREARSEAKNQITALKPIPLSMWGTLRFITDQKRFHISTYVLETTEAMHDANA